MIKTYKEALDYFSKLELFGIKLGLEQTRLLAKFAGNPQRKLKFIHVAGTNGKGTICAMLASALLSAGFKTGLYTSPHLISPRERFKINGKAISEPDFAKFANRTFRAGSKLEKQGGHATYFEAATVMAMMYFASKKTDFVVWETGMGGRLDATNIVTPELSIISSIGLDHSSYLGKKIPDIAKEKAGIIKSQIPVFCGFNIGPSAKKVIKCRAKYLSSPIIFCDKKAVFIRHGKFSSTAFTGHILNYDGVSVPIPLPGIQLAKNLPLVSEALSYLAKKYKFNHEKSLLGLSKLSLCARLNVMPDSSLLDGGHNPQAISILVKNIKYYFGQKKFCVIFACMKDKDAVGMIKRLSKVASEFRFVPLSVLNRKSYSTQELFEIARNFKTDAKIFKTLKEAVEKKSERKIICGSFFLAGELLREYFTDEEIINWSK
jgi:dihydrofolate synthase/folylpolyglutamate synthase